MTKRHSTKQSLIASILVLCLCFTSLIGTTFAWFTDSVTSSGNKIVSGTLKVDLELLDKETSTWTSVKENNDPIFTYQNWEPGYVDAKVLKVENEGTLALKWKAKFTSADQLTDLANVIDVYVYAWGVLADASSVGYPADRNLTTYGYQRVGTLSEFVNTIESTTYGNLLAGEVAYLGIALKMQEGAGNEYQDMDLGGAFDIQIVATQMASENDSFGPDYDEGAQFPGEAGSASELIEALSNNENVKLSGDIDLSEIAWTPIAEYSGILDGNGYAIKNLTGENGLFDKISGATIKNLTLENVNITATSYHTGAVAGYAIKNSEKQTVIENVTVSGSVNGGEYYTGGLLGADSNYDTVIKDCVNNATVVGGSNYTGGIVGYATRGSVITACTNNGSVSGGSFVGGIVGFAAGDDTMANLSVVISDCVNTGKVEVTNTTVGWADCVGGIAGACGRVGGDYPVTMLNFYLYDCTVVDGQSECGRLYNVATGEDELITLFALVSDGLLEDTNGDYYVYNAAGLKWIASTVSAGDTMSGKTIKLMTDIDLENEAWTPIGINEDPGENKPFSGTFDGQGHTVYNLYIYSESTTVDSVGFIGSAKNANIKNLTIENVDIFADYFVGAIVGKLTTGTISNCHVKGDISIVAGRNYAAGIVGDGYYKMEDCSVIANGMGTITSNAVAGGLCGRSNEGTGYIKNCVVKNLNIQSGQQIAAISGYVHYGNTISGCTVENVNLTLTATSVMKPAIGLASGLWFYRDDSPITISDNTFKDVTISAVNDVTGTTNILYGWEWNDHLTGIVESNNAMENVTNNLNYQ